MSLSTRTGRGGEKVTSLVSCSVLLFGNYYVYLVVNSKFPLKSIAKVRKNKRCAGRLHSNPQKCVINSSGYAKVSKDKYVKLDLQEMHMK